MPLIAGLADLCATRGGILTGMLPGKPIDDGGKAGGGSFNISFWGEAERDGRVFGECIGDEDVSEAELDEPGLLETSRGEG